MSMRTLPFRSGTSRRTTLPIPAQRARNRMALYLRLSVADLEDGERDVSAGINRQREDALAVARRRGVPADAVVRLHTDREADRADVVLYIEDGESAWKRRKVTIRDQYGETRQAWRVIRPVWGQMMRDIRAGEFGSAIVYNSDRLARDPYDVEDIIETAERYGVTWDAATGSLDLTTDDGRTMLRIMTAVANKSSADTARRVARAHAQRVAEGMPNWRSRPWGHRVVRETGPSGKARVVRIELEPREADAMVTVANNILDKGWTLARCARWLDEQGIPTSSGGRWTEATERYACHPRTGEDDNGKPVYAKRSHWTGDAADCPRCSALPVLERGKVEKGTGGSGVLLGTLLRQPRVAGILTHNGAEVGRSEHIPPILPERRWRALVAKLDARAALTRGPSGGANRGLRPLTGKDGVGRCEVCDGHLTTQNMKPTKTATEKVVYYKCVKGCVTIQADLVDQELSYRTAMAGAQRGVTILPGDPRPDTSADEARLAEVEQELVIWRGALKTRTAFGVPVTLETIVPEISRLELERDEIVKRIKDADAAVESTEDVELNVWSDLNPDELRQAVKRVFARVVILRRYDDQADDTERIVSTFTESFVPAGAEGSGPVIGYMLGTVARGRGGWKVAR